MSGQSIRSLRMDGFVRNVDPLWWSNPRRDVAIVTTASLQFGVRRRQSATRLIWFTNYATPKHLSARATRLSPPRTYA